jgi:hypothetical protein
MAAVADPQKPSCKALRTVGWCIAGAMALTGHLLAPSPSALLLELVGALVFAISTVRPSALRPLQVLIVPFLRVCPGCSGLLIANTPTKSRVSTGRRRQAA